MYRLLTSVLFPFGLVVLPVNAAAQGGLDWSLLNGPSGFGVQKTLDQCVTTPLPATVNCTFNVVITANVTASWGPISISDVSSAWLSNVVMTYAGNTQACQEQHPNPSFYHTALQVQIVTGAMACSLPAMTLNAGDTVSFTIAADLNLNQGHAYDGGEYSNCIAVEATGIGSSDQARDFSCVRFPATPREMPFENCQDAPPGMVFWEQFDINISPSELPLPGLASPHPVDANRQLVASDLVDLGGNLHAGRFLRRSDFQSRVRYDRPTSGINPFAMGRHDFTIDAWVRIPAIHAAAPVQQLTILDMRSVPTANVPNRGVALFITANYGLGFQMTTNASLTSQTQTWETSQTIVDGQWHHITVTVDRDNPNNSRIWIDGTPVLLTNTGYSFDPTQFQNTSLGNGQTMVIGFDRPQQVEAPAFDIDEIEIFHRVLDRMEIRTLATAPKCRFRSRGDMQ